jgi:hypothetical protein
MPTPPESWQVGLRLGASVLGLVCSGGVCLGLFSSDIA